MKSIRTFTIFYSLVILSPACATFRLTDGITISHEVTLGTGYTVKDGYGKLPEVDLNDFEPPSTPMSTETHYVFDGIVGGRISYRQRLADSRWFLGAQSDYFWFTGRGNYQQQLQRTYVNWWDQVLGAEAVLKRSPSIGGCIGVVLGKIGIGSDAMLQYSLSISHYDLDVNVYEGIDVSGGQNYSAVKGSSDVSSGLAIRHGLEIGEEYYVRAIIWFETDGSRQFTSGLTLVLSLPPEFNLFF